MAAKHQEPAGTNAEATKYHSLNMFMQSGIWWYKLVAISITGKCCWLQATPARMLLDGVCRKGHSTRLFMLRQATACTQTPAPPGRPVSITAALLSIVAMTDGPHPLERRCPRRPLYTSDAPHE